MKLLVLLLSAIAILGGATLSAQDISGSWRGILWADTSPLRSHTDIHTVLQISRSDSGQFKAVYYDNIDVSKRPLRVTSITLANRELAFSIEPMNLHFTGKVSADGTAITGALNNGPLDFRRMSDATHVTPEQLKQIVAESRGMTDGAAAKKLYRLEVTERLTAAQVAEYQAGLPGMQDKQALMALSDKASFLDASPAEIATLPKPDMDAQRKMIALSVDYVMKAFHNLPNLYATRLTTSFEAPLGADKPLHPAGRSSAVVLYRNGKEQLHTALFHAAAPGLTTSGEFGPILADALLDAAHGNLTWSHWEQGREGPEAVYRYRIDAEHSHYRVDGLSSAYEGEMAIDPVKGTILRLVFRSKLEPPNPLLAGDILVEYGPVELGGQVYICPVRSVALSQDPQVQLLNDVVFEQYHLYRANTRLITEPNEDP